MFRCFNRRRFQTINCIEYDLLNKFQVPVKKSIGMYPILRWFLLHTGPYYTPFPYSVSSFLDKTPSFSQDLSAIFPSFMTYSQYYGYCFCYFSHSLQQLTDFSSIFQILHATLSFWTCFHFWCPYQIFVKFILLGLFTPFLFRNNSYSHHSSVRFSVDFIHRRYFYETFCN